ncbi:MAG: dephospho-CoA kinase [Thiohalomonadaceae bacterium]
MLRVGLTGGIGSGKSTACAYFQAEGVPVVDTDQIARQLLQPGQPLLSQVLKVFGPEYQNEQGKLNRAALREKVFGSPAQLARLEGLLHPAIRQSVHQQLQTLQAAYVIIAIPLLVEKGWQGEVDRVLVVDCDEALQLHRASQRDHCDPAAIRQLMRFQSSRQQRLAAADDIIHNDGSTESLRQQVQALHLRYLKMAKPSS